MEQMEAVLGRLSEIESAAVALEEKAAEQKKQIAAEYEAKTQAFDKEIDAQTAEKLKTLNEKLRLEAENEAGDRPGAGGHGCGIQPEPREAGGCDF